MKEENQYEKLHGVYSEAMADKYARKIEPLNEALERFEEGYEKLYAPIRPLLDQYNELLMKFYDERRPELKSELMRIQPILSTLIRKVDKEGDSYQEEIKKLKEELDRIERVFFPTREDVEKN